MVGERFSSGHGRREWFSENIRPNIAYIPNLTSYNSKECGGGGGELIFPIFAQTYGFMQAVKWAWLSEPKSKKILI